MRIFSHVLPNVNTVFMCVPLTVHAVLGIGVFGRVGGGGVMTSLNLHACLMLRHTWGGVGCNDIVELARMFDATSL